MNAFKGCLILASLLYGIFVDSTFWKIYGAVVACYFVFVLWQRDGRENPKRKTLLISTWNQPSDPTAYVVNEYQMDNAMDFVKKCNADQKDVHITMTHAITLSCAWGLYKMRRDVGRLPFGTFKHSKRIGVTVLVDVEGGKDLVPVTIWDAHKMSIFEVGKIITEKVQRAKSGKDDRHNKATAAANYIPSFVAQPFAFALTYLSATVGINLGFLGLRNDAFGHVVITNVGPMGYNSAFAPLCPPVHQIALICTGKIDKRAIVDKEDGDKIKVANMMTCVSAGDHRYGDAAIMQPFFVTMRGYMEGPADFDEKKYKDVPHHKEVKQE